MLSVFSKHEFSIVSNLRFISRTNFMFSSVEHEKYFIVSGPGCELQTKVSAGKTECTVTELPWLLKAHLLCSSCSQHFSSKLNIH